MATSAMECKLNVKPLMGFMRHTEFWEGPCRAGIKEEMMPEAEMARAKDYFERYKAAIGELLPEVNVLEPMLVDYDESFVVSPEYIKAIEKDMPETDVIIVMQQRIPKIERFNKPVVSFTHTVSAADTCAYLRSIGREAYYPIDVPELNDILHLLWVRKAISLTRPLILTAGEAPTFGLLSKIRDTEGLRSRYGFEVISHPFTDIFPAMDAVDQAEAEKLADTLYKGAKENKVKPEWLAEDLKYYIAADKLMDKYGCNAFSTACVELCRSRIPQERKFVPCIAHTLNKDRGIPSACEEDLNAMLAMTVMMYLAGRPAFMGNPLYVSDEMVSIHHSVPCLKMNGFDQPDLDYSVYAFTGQGWGGKIQIDFAQNREDEVTIARFDPTGTKMLVKVGKVVRTEYKDTYCSPYYFIEVEDCRTYLHRMMDFGHHQALVFGNHLAKIRALSEVMGFTVIEG